MGTNFLNKGNEMRGLAGNVTIVTSGVDGIGRAIHCHFSDTASKVAVSDINAETAERVAGEIRNGGGAAEAIIAGLIDLEAVKLLAPRSYRAVWTRKRRVNLVRVPPVFSAGNSGYGPRQYGLAE